MGSWPPCSPMTSFGGVVINRCYQGMVGVYSSMGGTVYDTWNMQSVGLVS